MKHRHDEVEYRHQVDLPGRGRREHGTEFISRIPDLAATYHLGPLGVLQTRGHRRDCSVLAASMITSSLAEQET
jgi:hypothetical protein